MAEQWYSILEYARQYDMSDMTVRRRIKSGKLHAVLKEGKYYIPVVAKSQAPSKSAEMRYRSPGVSDHLAQVTAPSSPAVRPLPDSSAWKESRPATRQSEEAHFIPNALREPLLEAASAGRSTTVEMRALLAFCESSLKRSLDSEARLEANFKNKADSLYEQLRHKDTVVSQLKQQVEDLQVLIQMMEKKS